MFCPFCKPISAPIMPTPLQVVEDDHRNGERHTKCTICSSDILLRLRQFASFISVNILKRQSQSPQFFFNLHLIRQDIYQLDDTILCDKVFRWLATGRWFSPDTPVSSTNKNYLHDVTEVLLKVAWNILILINETYLELRPLGRSLCLYLI